MITTKIISGVMTVLCILALIAVAGCGAPLIETVETLDMDWGSISLLKGWKVVENDGERVTLSNIDFEHLTVYTNITENPKNFETWAVGFAIPSGRTPGKVSSRVIDGIRTQSFTSLGRSGKAMLNETLYLLPLDDGKALTIVTAIPDESNAKHQVNQILDSVKVVH